MDVSNINISKPSPHGPFRCSYLKIVTTANTALMKGGFYVPSSISVPGCTVMFHASVINSILSSTANIMLIPSTPGIIRYPPLEPIGHTRVITPKNFYVHGFITDPFKSTLSDKTHLPICKMLASVWAEEICEILKPEYREK
jgi:hypothetical protein